MNALSNPFKQALLSGQVQIGMWLGLPHAYTAEICAGAGFDWLVVDLEHVPNTLQTVLAQLQALAAYPVAPVVRPAWNDPVQIKQILDTGAQSLLIPMIESGEDARAAVAAVRYPPQGVRGVGSALARSSRWNRIPNYLHSANSAMCVIAQIETRKGLERLDDILAVEGIDAVFVGPADLSAAMGHLGDPNHADVVQAIDQVIEQARKAGKPVGILQADRAMATRYIERGATLVAVGVDATLLARATEDLAAHFKQPGHKARAGSASPY